MFKDFPSVKGNVLFDAQMTSYDMATLEGIVETIKPAVSLEIGSWKGISSSIIARHSQVLYCVDTWRGGSEPDASSMVEEAKDIDVFQVFEHNLKVQGLRDKVKPLYMSSEEAQLIVKKGSFNFIYIDGGHGFDDIMMDLNWWDYLAPGGTLAGHDFDEGHYEVMKAVRNKFSNFQQYPHSSIWSTCETNDKK